MAYLVLSRPTVTSGEDQAAQRLVVVTSQRACLVPASEAPYELLKHVVEPHGLHVDAVDWLVVATLPHINL